MHRGLWELAAIIFILSVLGYVAYNSRSILGYIVAGFGLLFMLYLVWWATMHMRHRGRMLEAEYEERITRTLRIVESNKAQEVNMIEAPRQQWWDTPVDDYVEQDTTSKDYIPQPKPIVNPVKTNRFSATCEPKSTIERAEIAYKGGATNREKLAGELGVTNRKARDLISRLKGK